MIDRLLLEFQNIRIACFEKVRSVYRDGLGAHADSEAVRRVEESQSVIWKNLSKGLKKFTDKITKGKNTSTLEYAKIIKELFEEFYFFEEWILSEKDESNMEKSSLESTEF